MRPTGRVANSAVKLLSERELRAPAIKPWRGRSGTRCLSRRGGGGDLSPDRPSRLNDSKQLEADRGKFWRNAFSSVRCLVDCRVDAATLIHQYLSGFAVPCEKRQPIGPQPDFLLVDAVSIDLPLPQRGLIKGDARCHAIARRPSSPKCIATLHARWDAVFPAYGLACTKATARQEHCRPLRSSDPHAAPDELEPVRSRSLFPLNYNSQMELFEAAGADDHPMRFRQTTLTSGRDECRNDGAAPIHYHGIKKPAILSSPLLELVSSC